MAQNFPCLILSSCLPHLLLMLSISIVFILGNKCILTSVLDHWIYFMASGGWKDEWLEIQKEDCLCAHTKGEYSFKITSTGIHGQGTPV